MVPAAAMVPVAVEERLGGGLAGAAADIAKKGAAGRADGRGQHRLEPAAPTVAPLLDSLALGRGQLLGLLANRLVLGRTALLGHLLHAGTGILERLLAPVGARGAELRQHPARIAAVILKLTSLCLGIA